MSRPETYRTLPTLLVLGALAAEPGREMYGLQIMEATGRGSGTVYPALARLEAGGLIELRAEDIDPKTAGRPARKMYRLTAAGVAEAQAQGDQIRNLFPPRIKETPENA